MADLQASAVTVLRSWTEGGVTGKDRIAKRVSLVLTGHGGLTNKITATALGFRVIEECSNAKNDDVGQHVVPAVPANDGSAIYLAAVGWCNQDGSSKSTPGDWTSASNGPFVMVVKGY